MGLVVTYHQALRAIERGDFEGALGPLTRLLQAQAETPELADACGLVLPRRAEVLAEVPPADRTHVRAAGEAYCAHLARRSGDMQERFEQPAARHPRERYVHYGYGLALAQQGKVEALAQFEREIELFPDDVLARIELVLGLVTLGRAAEAVGPAEKAKALAPCLFATRLALGRASSRRASSIGASSISNTPGSHEVIYAPKAGHDECEPAEAERINAMEFVARILLQIPDPRRGFTVPRCAPKRNP